ncbi:hypothetical protein [Actinomadura sp. 9N215]|uniref:hypothetical protein n=1 Tax=Actinomadura sp. 9N215 TaxID=3375150 RepID=UPI0037A28582
MRWWKTLGLWKAPGLWKTLGLAGVLGVAATGAVIVRSERRRRAYTPDEVRRRLHERLGESPPGEGA